VGIDPALYFTGIPIKIGAVYQFLIRADEYIILVETTLLTINPFGLGRD
jgi:hypothetical protein